MSHHHHNDASRIKLALILTFGFMLVEVAGGLYSGSLALLADAGHMLTDSLALALALFAMRLTHKKADPKHSFGYHRFTTLAAFVNAASLIVIVGFIVYEAIERFLTPSPILGASMMLVAVVGLVVNVAAFIILHGGSKQNLNIKGAALHVMGDMLGSAGAIIAALIIILTGWTPIDPILSVLVSLLVLKSAWGLLIEATNILLEGAPENLSADKIKQTLIREVDAVENVHHIHIWSLSLEKPLVTLHATLSPDSQYQSSLQAIHQTLRKHFAIEHATVQLEKGYCSDSEQQTI